jgi:hypothetical protein
MERARLEIVKVATIILKQHGLTHPTGKRQLTAGANFTLRAPENYARSLQKARRNKAMVVAIQCASTRVIDFALALVGSAERLYEGKFPTDYTTLWGIK